MDLSPLASGYRISNPPGLLAASYEGCLSVSCISLLVVIYQRYSNKIFHCSLAFPWHSDLFYTYFIRFNPRRFTNKPVWVIFERSLSWCQPILNIFSSKDLEKIERNQMRTELEMTSSLKSSLHQIQRKEVASCQSQLQPMCFPSSPNFLREEFW